MTAAVLAPNPANNHRDCPAWCDPDRHVDGAAIQIGDTVFTTDTVHGRNVDTLTIDGDGGPDATVTIAVQQIPGLPVDVILTVGPHAYRPSPAQRAALMTALGYASTVAA